VERGEETLGEDDEGLPRSEGVCPSHVRTRVSSSFGTRALSFFMLARVEKIDGGD
jgi:hypothetical protein